MGFARNHLIRLTDEGLGNSAYLVDLGDGRALAVDASRDLRALRRAAEGRGLRVALAADTHLHADFLTGALRLAAEDGARVLASAAGDRAYAHRALAEGDEVDLGGLTLRALATPGHTREHLSYLLLDGPTPVGVFTGGSLIVGSAARTDLVDPALTLELAHAQYASLHRLAELPDATPVWPTHGAGSFCSAPSGQDRTTTIGAQKLANPLLAAPDADAFADLLISGLGTYPPYFDRLGEVNRAGPEPLSGEPRVPELDSGRARRMLADGVLAVDVRPVDRFAAGHVPGALSNALRPSFATWLGWIVADPATPWIAVTEPGQDVAEAAWQALKIGHRPPDGHLPAAAWDGPLTTIPRLTADRIEGRTVLDVRQDDEFTSGHIPSARHIELGALARTAAATGPGPGEPTVVMCGHGERAATGASLLLRRGARDVAVLHGGPGDWAALTGRALQEGE
ncbi:MBL fold metallo-hydrolase [Actinomadura oligospora]|uniref:MBL fold metallo-hydrolase n=1 Tax=Actinomadura oligospora TaxID=111804 RepID=UPI00047BB13A|nr:rhodanese-like domain-containing protein [Actinomadura oligospora]